MSEEEAHTCPICLEPIFQPPEEESNNQYSVGATVPCGHLYHFDCFGSWQASKSYGAVKCPTCNIKTKDFIRLYLDVATLSGAQCHLADDDISLSSVEESKCDEDESDRKTDNDSDGEKDESHVEQNTAVDNKDENDVGVVDLTDSPQRPKSQPLQSSFKNDKNDDDDPQHPSDDLRRLSRIAKKFKKQYLQKSAQYKEQYTEKRKLSDRTRQAEGEVKTLKDKMSEIEADKRLLQIMMNESKLDLERMKSERDELWERCAWMQEEKTRIQDQRTQAESKFQQCHAIFRKELEEARAKSMSEVQEIMEEHPKVVEENRILKQKIKTLELQRRDRSLSRSFSSTGSDANRKSHSKAKELQKALRKMDEASRFPPQNSSAKNATVASNPFERAEKRTAAISNPFETIASEQHSNKKRKMHDISNSSNQRPSMTKVGSGQYSSFASRMMKASEKTKKVQAGTSSATKNRTSVADHFLSSSQSKRMKSISAARRDLFQRRP